MDVHMNESPATHLVNTKNVLSVNNLSCLRNDQLLFENLDFNLASGEILQITGPNGCGKTSLLRNICSLSLPDQGEVSWNGKNIRENRPEYLQNICYVGHSNGIKGELTPLENLNAAKSLTVARDDLDPEQALEQMGLIDYEYLPTKKLSSGQRRRVALARLLITQACLWILDEPFTSLDDSGREILKNKIEAHINNGGMTIVVTHDPIQISEHQIKSLNL